MKKSFQILLISMFILQFSIISGTLFADEPIEKEVVNEAENEIAKAEKTTTPTDAIDEFLHAGGTFWRPTAISHASATFGLSFLDWDSINGSAIFFDFTFMLEYSIEQYTNMPMSLFAQTGLALHYVDIIQSDTNFGFLNFWLGGKYRMINGDTIPNLFLSFMATIGIGYNDTSDNVGNAQWAGHYMLNSGDFSLIFGGLASYLVKPEMGVGGSLLFQFFTWSTGATDRNELGLHLHVEYFYIVSADVMTHIGLTNSMDDDIDNQNWKFFAQAMHISGLYGQIIIPLEGNGFVLVLMGGYNIKFP
ncbi:MAG: hypothetical protein K8S87_12350 [Planctomycetes bacterium]|nr:hypothetical protein [Planctomycetota bacterium]